MSNSFGYLHIGKKLGKKNGFGQKPGFPGFPLPDKTEVYSQTREISRVWRYRVDIDIL